MMAGSMIAASLGSQPSGAAPGAIPDPLAAMRIAEADVGMTFKKVELTDKLFGQDWPAEYRACHLARPFCRTAYSPSFAMLDSHQRQFTAHRTLPCSISASGILPDGRVRRPGFLRCTAFCLPRA